MIRNQFNYMITRVGSVLYSCTAVVYGGYTSVTYGCTRIIRYREIQGTLKFKGFEVRQVGCF